MTAPKASLAELTAVLERTPFLAHYGFAVRACSPEECVLHVLTHSRIEA